MSDTSMETGLATTNLNLPSQINEQQWNELVESGGFLSRVQLYGSNL